MSDEPIFRNEVTQSIVSGNEMILGANPRRVSLLIGSDPGLIRHLFINFNGTSLNLDGIYLPSPTSPWTFTKDDMGSVLTEEVHITVASAQADITMVEFFTG